MGYKRSSLSCLALLLAFSSCIHAFDVLKVLDSDPEFSLFIKALTDTKLVDEINKRSTVTVLALNNAAMSSLNGKSSSTLKDILSTHLVLNFYDEKALFYANTEHTKMPTLFQASGKALNDQGYIYVSLINEGEIAFASAVNNAPYKSLLVRTVSSEPSTISVLEVSAPIIAPGIETTATPVVASAAPVPSPPKATVATPAPTKATAPAKSTVTAKAPTTVTVTAKAPAPAATTVAAKAPAATTVAAKAPAATTTVAAKAPAPATTAPAPVASAKQAPAPAQEVSNISAPAPAQEAEAPVDVAAGPGPVAGEAPASDDKAAPPHSSATSTKFGFVAAVIAMASLFVSL